MNRFEEDSVWFLRGSSHSGPRLGTISFEVELSQAGRGRSKGMHVKMLNCTKRMNLGVRCPAFWPLNDLGIVELQCFTQQRWQLTLGFPGTQK